MMERSRNKPVDRYVALIESRRDDLSDDDMETLLALHEQPTKRRAAAELGMTPEELESRIAELFPPKVDERLTKKGLQYKKRLSRTAYTAILIELDVELTDEERAIIAAIAESPNQSVAAHSLGMTYKEFDRAHARIRRDHDF